MVFSSKRVKLPKAINFVEYLQSSGTQFFNTDFVPDGNTRVVMDCEVLQFITAAYCGCCTQTPSASTATNALIVIDSTSVRSDFYGSVVSSASVANGRHIVDRNKNVTKIGSSITITNTASTNKSGYPLFLCARNAIGTADLQMSMKLYSCQIYDNDVLVRDYWPCYDPDGVACLYDKVSKEYVYNAGTGEFIAEGDAPSMDKALSNYNEGDIVLLNESGSPVEFYVAKHDYESGLNGAGRTLLVRKDVHSNQVWDAGSTKLYTDSDLDAWFNGSYLALLDAAVQTAIGQTKIYVATSDTAKTTASRAVFALSMAEFGRFGEAEGIPTEGAELPISDSLLCIAYLNGVATTQLMRSSDMVYTAACFALNGSGKETYPAKTAANGARPAFTLPATAPFSAATNCFKGGAA